MVQKKDLKSLSFRQGPDANGTVHGERVPDGYKRNVYLLKTSLATATAAQFEMNERFSNTSVSDTRRDFTYFATGAVPVVVPTRVDIVGGPVITFNQQTYMHFRTSTGEVDVTMLYADEPE